MSIAAKIQVQNAQNTFVSDLNVFTKKLIWNVTGDVAIVSKAVVVHENSDIKQPLIAMRKRLHSKGFTLEVKGKLWYISQKEITQKNWQTNLFDF